jgi:hypothetical protein
MSFTLSSLGELVSLEACELVPLDSVVSLDVLTKLERDDEIELELLVMLDPVPLLLTLLESRCWNLKRCAHSSFRLSHWSRHGRSNHWKRRLISFGGLSLMCM